MAGMRVYRDQMDMKTSDAVLSLRSAFDKVESIATWLANNPSNGTDDPLVTEFNYTADEAYVIRVTFENFNAMRNNNQGTFDTARKLTGLE